MIPFHIPRPQGCDIQTFYGKAANRVQYSWSKPTGVSHIYMMLIGGGGNRNAADAGAGGSGGVTVWYGAAQHVPNNLSLLVSSGQGIDTRIYYNRLDSNLLLLSADSAGSSIAGAAVAANAFAASGFYQSTAGQNGQGSAAQSASATTFLSGGAGGATVQTVTANYGYSQRAGGYGSFQMQPIIVGVGNNALAGNDSVAAIGCGGSSTSGATPGYGGPGMILIASW